MEKNSLLMESRTLEQQPAEQLQRSLCDFPTHSRSITITITTIGPIYTAVCMSLRLMAFVYYVVSCGPI